MRYSHGFALMEVLIAMFIFMLLLGGIYESLIKLVQTRNYSDQRIMANEQLTMMADAIQSSRCQLSVLLQNLIKSQLEKALPGAVVQLDRAGNGCVKINLTAQKLTRTVCC